jgi:catechol 2,3-dioxygenase-like lactoylglutathione lyase family enzyme
MFDHIGIKVKNLHTSQRFYDAALRPLGYRQCSSGADEVGYGAGDQPAFWLYRGQSGGTGSHTAFKAGDRQSVDSFHSAGLDAGGHDNGKPGLRADYSPSYYAAFLLDPDGNNVEAVSLTENGRWPRSAKMSL